MKKTIRSFRIMGLGTLTALMLAACGHRDNADGADTDAAATTTVETVPGAVADTVVQNLQVAKIDAMLDSVGALRTAVYEKYAPIAGRVDSLRHAAGVFRSENSKLIIRARNEYFARLAGMYPMRCLPANEYSFYSDLAKKIMEDSYVAVFGHNVYFDARWTPSAMVRGGVKPDAYHFVNVMDAVLRVAAGTASIVDIEAMVYATAFDKIDAGVGSLSQLADYVSVGGENTLRGTKTKAAQLWAEYVSRAGEVDVNVAVQNLATQNSELARRERQGQELALRRYKRQHADVLGKRSVLVDDELARLRANGANGQDAAAQLIQDACGTNINFQIPEMRKIKSQILENQSIIDSLEKQADELQATYDKKCAKETAGYVAQIDSLAKIKAGMLEKQK